MPRTHHNKPPSFSLADLNTLFFDERSSAIYQNPARLSAELGRLQPASSQEILELLDFALYSGATLETKILIESLEKVIREASAITERMGILKGAERIEVCVSLARRINDAYLYEREAADVRRSFEQAGIEVAALRRILEEVGAKVELTRDSHPRAKDLIGIEVEINIVLEQLSRF